MPENNVKNVVALLRQMRDYAQKEFKRAHATASFGDSSCFEYQHQADAYDDAMGAHFAAQTPKGAPKRPAVYFPTPDPTSPSDGPQMRHRPVPPKWVGPIPGNQPHPPNLRPKYDAVLNGFAGISFRSLTKNQKKKAMESLLYIFHYYGVKFLDFTAANYKNLVYRLN